jgi:hypothetical protein
VVSTPTAFPILGSRAPALLAVAVLVTSVSVASNSSTDPSFVEQIGLFYDLPRSRDEGLESYRKRVADHIRGLAEDKRARETGGR